MFSLENDKNYLQIAIDLMPISIMIVEEDLTVNYANNYFINMFNKSEKKVVNQRPGDSICCINSLKNQCCGFSEDCKACKLRKLILDTSTTRSASEPIEMEIQIVINKKIENRWFKINTIPISKNEIKQILIVFQDITEYKNVNKKLLRLKEEAETANKIKSEFLANISHEIRTPLNGIIGMTDLTIATNLNEEQKENLEVVKNCADTLLSLINDVLDLSKIEAEKVTLENIEFNLNLIIKRVINIHLAKSNEKNINLTYSIDENLPDSLIGDSHRIEQVLNNLVGNSVKFTEKGYVKLEVKMVKKKDDIYKILFSIEDTGIGMNKYEMKSLFKSFSQVDSSITRKYGGTGLGLAISKELVNLMGGKINVSSKKGEGSRFYFYIDLREAEKYIVKPKYDLNITQSTKSANILVVEDDSINSLVIKRMLQEIGYNDVICASNGYEALKMFKHSNFDLILMDIQMPGIDGVETTEIIREREQGTKKHIPIIAITAYALNGDSERFLSKGMDEYISKPVNIKKLEQTIDRVISGKIDKDSEFIESFLKDKNETEITSSIAQKNKESFSDKIKKISECGNRYETIEKIAHEIKIQAEHLKFNIIKNSAFRIEMAARKKDDEGIKSNCDKISDFLKITKIIK